MQTLSVPRGSRISHNKANNGPRTKICSNNLAGLPIGEIPIDSGTARLEVVAPTGVTLYVNEAPSSFLDLADPGFLAFEYFQQMNVVLCAVKPEPQPVKVLHLGAAGCALARAWDATRPGSRQVAVDIDAALVKYVREWFDLPAAPALRIRAQSADDAVATAKPGSYDIIVRDVFSGNTTPLDLTTSEFTARIAQALKPDGLYLANCADRPPLKEAKRELVILGSIFPAVAAIAEVAVLAGKRYGNVVLAASSIDNAKFDSPQLARALRSLPAPAKIITGSELENFLA